MSQYELDSWIPFLAKDFFLLFQLVFTTKESTHHQYARFSWQQYAENQ